MLPSHSNFFSGVNTKTLREMGVRVNSAIRVVESAGNEISNGVLAFAGHLGRSGQAVRIIDGSKVS